MSMQRMQFSNAEPWGLSILYTGGILMQKSGVCSAFGASLSSRRIRRASRREKSPHLEDDRVAMVKSPIEAHLPVLADQLSHLTPAYRQVPPISPLFLAKRVLWAHCARHKEARQCKRMACSREISSGAGASPCKGDILGPPAVLSGRQILALLCRKGLGVCCRLAIDGLALELCDVQALWADQCRQFGGYPDQCAV